MRCRNTKTQLAKFCTFRCIIVHICIAKYNRFHWQSQSNATATGKAGTLYQNHESEGIRIHLFMRKADKEQGKTLPFTYFGQLKHLQSTGSKPISVTWSLHSPLSIELFKEWQTLS